MNAIQNSKGMNLTKAPAAAVERLKELWSGLAPKQRVSFYVAAGLTVAALAFFAHLIMSPNYKILLSGVEPEDMQDITGQLAAKKIAYEIGSDGKSIRVPADQVDAARLEIASHESPRSGRIGFEIFDKASWGETEFDEKVNYQRALEGELERTIQTIRNVKSARVHIVMANDSLFSDRERSAKASVTLRMRHGSLTRDEVGQIARLVAGSVDHLDAKDVVITDADANRTLGGGSGGSGDGDTLDDQLTQRLIATLAPVVGGDRIRATVNVEEETGSSEENDEKYDPNVSVTLNMQRSEETAGGAAQGGVPGTSSNVPGQKVNPTGNPTPAPSSKTESATYGVNKTTRHVLQPAGGIRRITAAVLLDDAVDRHQQNGKWVTTKRKRTPDEIKMINDLAQAAIGFNAARGDVVTVQNLGFDRPDDSDLGPESFLDKARKSLSEFSSVIRYVGLAGMFILVYFLVIRPFQKRALAAVPAPAPQPAITAPLTTPPALEVDTLKLAERTRELKSEIADLIKEDPETGAAAVRAWLKEEM
jgi:flagellar M-ring protein FliF